MRFPAGLRGFCALGAGGIGAVGLRRSRGLVEGGVLWFIARLWAAFLRGGGGFFGCQVGQDSFATGFGEGWRSMPKVTPEREWRCGTGGTREIRSLALMILCSSF
jgi:hypothetical protein